MHTSKKAGQGREFFEFIIEMGRDAICLPYLNSFVVFGYLELGVINMSVRCPESVKNGFLRGMSRVLDLGATLEARATHEQTQNVDFHALKQDWIAVGNDIGFAMQEFQKAHGK